MPDSFHDAYLSQSPRTGRWHYSFALFVTKTSIGLDGKSYENLVVTSNVDAKLSNVRNYLDIKLSGLPKGKVLKIYPEIAKMSEDGTLAPFSGE